MNSATILAFCIGTLWIAASVNADLSLELCKGPREEIECPDTSICAEKRRDKTPACGAVNGYFCFKEYKNKCFLAIAQCINRNIRHVPCAVEDSLTPRLLTALLGQGIDSNNSTLGPASLGQGSDNSTAGAKPLSR